MDTKLFARIGAGAFVAIALTMTALELREEPVRQVPEAVQDANDGPLPGILRSCADMGESALNDPACRSAWAAKRRRFLGRDASVAAASEPLAHPVDPQPPKDQ